VHAETQYAKSGDAHIAFQARGDGPIDIVVDLVVGSGIEFMDRGEHKLKGVPGSWQLFAVAG
jgi:hypothetical protein